MEDVKYILMCVWYWEDEKWKEENFFYLVEKKKNEMIENITYIHLLSCFNYISKKFNSLKEKRRPIFGVKKLTVQFKIKKIKNKKK